MSSVKIVCIVYINPQCRSTFWGAQSQAFGWSKFPDISSLVEKFYPPGDLTVGQFLEVIKKRMKLKGMPLNDHNGIILLDKRTEQVLTVGKRMSELIEKDDPTIELTACIEETYGGVGTPRIGASV